MPDLQTGGLRKRIGKQVPRKVGDGSQEDDGSAHAQSPPTAAGTFSLDSGSFWLTRIIFTRSLGFIYCE